MKKKFTLLLTAIFCFIIISNAQINKGSVMLGGSISGGFNNLKAPDTTIATSNSFYIQPQLGFAISTNTILGFSLSYGSSKNRFNYNYDQKLHSYGAGVFLRKYKLLAKNFYLFGEGNLMYSYSTYNYSSVYSNTNKYDSKSNNILLSFTPGIAYNLTHCMQLEVGLQNLLSVGYSSATENAKTPPDQDYKASSFSFGSSLNPVSLNSISIGLRFLINK